MAGLRQSSELDQLKIGKGWRDPSRTGARLKNLHALFDEATLINLIFVAVFIRDWKRHPKFKFEAMVAKNAPRREVEVSTAQVFSLSHIGTLPAAGVADPGFRSVKDQTRSALDGACRKELRRLTEALTEAGLRLFW